MPTAQAATNAMPEAQKIDAILAKEWEKNNLKPNPPAPDDVMVRRLYLDIAGRIPTVEETQEFIRSNDPQKRARLIDKLLSSDGYASNMFNYWADVLRLTNNTKGRVTAEAYEEWLKNWDAGRDKSDRVTTRIECADYFEVRDDALRAHATQVDPEESFWFGLPSEVARDAHPWDDYVLARSLVDIGIDGPLGADGVYETDLFAGVPGR